ncbi:glycerol-3-phosphate acyltransferase PlsY [Methylohalomonas lacus]|uniref:Glycerol-3-phosphate acyltransferase n=1 Tax=Methylohalomonas lacus TaxID=398773 RepID=A0AAE3L4W7_9GAMM|nr:glycerol-3-phosphate 1-O-acyltransferase PlsY [Methylohalomonas lacus]MCS3904628.1 glycerol-3-phosphate acyltransferase PlsY [Methylohalomonas lacus]
MLTANLFAYLFVIAGYLLGSVASAIVVCRLLGLGDPRAGGSGNPGATNVMRLHGRLPALLTLAGDLLKGLLPVLAAQAFDQAISVVALTGLAAFLGHLYPVFFRFQGGKGVATLIGVLFGLYWLLGLGFVATWLVMAGLFRYSSLAAICAAMLTPVYTALLVPNLLVVGVTGVMTLFLIARHRSNIQNLMAGNEGRIGEKG